MFNKSSVLSRGTHQSSRAAVPRIAPPQLNRSVESRQTKDDVNCPGGERSGLRRKLDFSDEIALELPSNLSSRLRVPDDFRLDIKELSINERHEFSKRPQLAVERPTASQQAPIRPSLRERFGQPPLPPSPRNRLPFPPRLQEQRRVEHSQLPQDQRRVESLHPHQEQKRVEPSQPPQEQRQLVPSYPPQEQRWNEPLQPHQEQNYDLGEPIRPQRVLRGVWRPSGRCVTCQQLLPFEQEEEVQHGITAENDLPQEVLVLIMRNLNPRDLAEIRRTSKEMYSIVKVDLDDRWRRDTGTARGVISLALTRTPIYKTKFKQETSQMLWVMELLKRAGETGMKLKGDKMRSSKFWYFFKAILGWGSMEYAEDQWATLSSEEKKMVGLRLKLENYVIKRGRWAGHPGSYFNGMWSKDDSWVWGMGEWPEVTEKPIEIILPPLAPEARLHFWDEEELW